MDYYNVHDSTILHQINNELSSTVVYPFVIQTGSRFIVSLYVASGSVSLNVENGFSSEVPFEELMSEQLVYPNALTAGHHKFVFTDFHKLFKLTLIPDGAASCALGIAVHDNMTENVSVVDGLNKLEVNGDGSINANIVNPSELPENIRVSKNSISGIVKDIPTQLVSYTAPLDKEAYLQNIECGGDNIAKFSVFINGEWQRTKRSYFGGDLDISFSYDSYPENGLKLNPGDAIVVKVEHFRSNAGDFEGYIQIFEIG